MLLTGNGFGLMTRNHPVISTKGGEDAEDQKFYRNFFPFGLSRPVCHAFRSRRPEVLSDDAVLQYPAHGHDFRGDEVI
jgi:hypothetical protein